MGRLRLRGITRAMIIRLFPDKPLEAAREPIGVGGIIFNIAQGLKDVARVPVVTIRHVLETLKAKIADLVVTEPSDKGLQRVRVVMLNYFTEIYMQKGDRKDAITSAQDGLAITRVLAREKGDDQAQMELVVLLIEDAQISPNPGPLYHEALAILVELYREGRLDKERQGWIDWIKKKLAALPAAAR